MGGHDGDFQTISRLDGEVVLWCQDNDEAESLIESGQAHMTLSACLSKERIEEILGSYGEYHRAALAAVMEVVGNRKKYYRTYESIREEIL